MSEGRNLTASQLAMAKLWDEHAAYEFEAPNTEKTLATMTDDPVNFNVPLLTGGVDLEEARKYYSEYLIPKHPCAWRDCPKSLMIGPNVAPSIGSWPRR